MDIVSGVVDMLYPRRCAACGKPAGEAAWHVCWDCLAQLWPIQSPRCAKCGNPISGMVMNEYTCSFCRKDTPAYDKARSAVHFDGPIMTLLHHFKYSGAAWLSRDLGMLLGACISANFERHEVDAVIYVPLHHRKERERTYNQAALLAAYVADGLDIPVMHSIIARARDTPSQTSLSANKRKENVSGAFVVKNPRWADGRRFLLVDDVMTTGATVDECARQLKDAGAARVLVATVARGVA